MDQPQLQRADEANPIRWDTFVLYCTEAGTIAVVLYVLDKILDGFLSSVGEDIWRKVTVKYLSTWT